MTSIEDDLAGRVYGNIGNSFEKKVEVEQQSISRNSGNGKAKKGRENRKNDEKNDTVSNPTKRSCTTYKYSNKGKGDLHEAIILAGLPTFLKYENEQIKAIEQIEEAGRIIKPPYQDEYPYETYEFSSMEEVREYVKQAQSMKIDSLYTQTKQFVKDYNNQDGYKQNLIALDIIFSYFQDKFSTTYYVGIVGDNDSGKSSIGITFESICYRPIYMTDPSAPNIFRCLGSIEPGQSTIILDEADKIDKSAEMMAILKTGYQINGKVPKININTLRQRQQFFCTYGLKLIIAEKSMSMIEAKGVHDRTFSFTAYPGDSKFDIKETLNPQGNSDCQKRLNEIVSFRKMLLIYRLLHFKDAVANVDTGLKRRNRELVKPLLQLFCKSNLQIQKEISSTLQGFLKDKQRRKENTIEAALYPIITNLVSQHGTELPAKDIWNAIVEGNVMDGYYDEKRPNEYQTEDYGIIHSNSITNIICDKLGARKKHKEAGSVLIFDTDKLIRIGRSYDIETKIQLKLEDPTHAPDGPDGSDGSDGSDKSLTTPKENHNTEVTKADVPEGNLNNNINNTTEKSKGPFIIRIKSSEPSELSATSRLDIADDKIQKTSDTNDAIKTIYRLGHSDTFACHNCKNKGDKWFMQKHVC